jgi:DNA-binding CsgD family transcriptional regulator
VTIAHTLASDHEIPGRPQPQGLEQKNGLHANGSANGISQTAVACELLNKLPYGIVCVDEKLRIEFMNEAARMLLLQDDGLSICDNRLVAEMPKQTAQIQALVTQAAHGRACPPGSGAWTTRIPRRSVRRSFEIVASLVPLHVGHAPGMTYVLFIFDPDGELSPDAELVARLYGLTGAEVRVAIMLMQGKTLEQTSIILQRTKETVRKQLQSIFDKTNTNRQSELIRLLLRGPAALRF